MNKDNSIEAVEQDMMMTIFATAGTTQIHGPIKELQDFKKMMKNKENRHIFLEVPARLCAYNPALLEVTILPAAVGTIIIADPRVGAQQRDSRIARPGGPIPIRKQ